MSVSARQLSITLNGDAASKRCWQGEKAVNQTVALWLPLPGPVRSR
jgi:hypothetical protein